MPKNHPKHYTAERVHFGGGEVAIVFSDSFGTLIDGVHDTPIGGCLLIMPSGQRFGDCELVRFGSSDSREWNTVVSRTPVEVQVRETAFVVPSSLKQYASGFWKFGGNFVRTVKQYVYGYDTDN